MLPNLAFYNMNTLETWDTDWNAKLMSWELTWLSQLPNDKQTTSAPMFPLSESVQFSNTKNNSVRECATRCTTRMHMVC